MLPDGHTMLTVAPDGGAGSWSSLEVAGRHRGEGPPRTVLVHGWVTTHAVWGPVLQRWPEELGSVLAIDLPGGGRSSAPPGGYSIARWAAVVAAVVRAQPAPVRLVGHSMGGLIAMRAALDLADHLDQLVLVSPVPASGVDLPPEAVAGFKALHGTRAGVAQLITGMLAREVPAARLSPVLDGAETVCRAACHEGLDAWTGADFADELAALAVPTRVISGEREQPLSPEFLQSTVLKHVFGSTLEVLPGAGHYPQLEVPGALTAALARALGGPG